MSGVPYGVINLTRVQVTTRYRQQNTTTGTQQVGDEGSWCAVGNTMIQRERCNTHNMCKKEEKEAKIDMRLACWRADYTYI